MLSYTLQFYENQRPERDSIDEIDDVFFWLNEVDLDDQGSTESAPNKMASYC